MQYVYNAGTAPVILNYEWLNLPHTTMQFSRLAVIVAAFTCCEAHPPRAVAQTYAEHVYTGFGWQTFGSYAPGDQNRLFVATIKFGQIDVLNLDTRTLDPIHFLDLSSDFPNPLGAEQGLLGLAFDPNYATNGYFYVNYTRPDNSIEVRRYRVLGDPATSNVADPTSGHTIINIPRAGFIWHNGGWIGFGPNDGHLYISTGDPGGDLGGNAQDLTDNSWGKILRVDVNGDDFPADPKRNYAIPASNPFVGKVGDDEIWAYGLRNPWRASFDRQTGDLWINDTGEATKEEVNFQPSASPGGVNYGWPYREGTVIGPPGHGLPASPAYTEPVYDYDHNDPNPLYQGTVITASQLYRGPIAAFHGDYFFVDFASRNIWKLDPDAVDMRASVTNVNDLLIPNVGIINGISSFGEDAAGNLYLMDWNIPGQSRIWRIATSSKDAIWNGDSATAGAAGDGVSWGDSSNWTRGGAVDAAVVAEDHVVFAPGSSQPVVYLGVDRVVSAVTFSASHTLDGNKLTVLSGNVKVEAGVTAIINSGLASESVNHSIRKLGSGKLVVDGIAGQIAVKEGTLGGSGACDDLTVRPGAAIAPGDAAGILTVARTFTMYPGAELSIDIGGRDNSDLQNPQFDGLVIGDSAILAGTLSVRLIDVGAGVFSPAAGDSFTILTATDGIIGSFDAVNLPTLQAGLLWNQVVKEHTFTLTVNRFPGDFNSNGQVDAADYVIWRNSQGETGGGSAADATGPNGLPDGVVDELDYEFWRSRFGSIQTASFSAEVAVPEPETFVLVIVGILSICTCRRTTMPRIRAAMTRAKYGPS